MCKFADDGGVDVGVETREDVLQTCKRGHELVEYNTVVLHFRAKPRSLEQAFSIPVQIQSISSRLGLCLALLRSIGGRERQANPVRINSDGRVEPFIQKCRIE